MSNVGMLTYEEARVRTQLRRTEDMTTATALPSIESCDEALNALGELFDALPPSHRPLHAGNREDIRRLLDRIRRYVIAQQPPSDKKIPPAPLAASDSPADKPADKPARSRAEGKKSMSPIEIFDAIMALKSDVDRKELFDQLLNACCPDCGAKAGPVDEHDCPAADEDDDDEDDDQEEPDEEAKTRDS